MLSLSVCFLPLSPCLCVGMIHVRVTTPEPNPCVFLIGWGWGVDSGQKKNHHSFGIAPHSLSLPIAPPPLLPRAPRPWRARTSSVRGAPRRARRGRGRACFPLAARNGSPSSRSHTATAPPFPPPPPLLSAPQFQAAGGAGARREGDRGRHRVVRDGGRGGRADDQLDGHHHRAAAREREERRRGGGREAGRERKKHAPDPPYSSPPSLFRLRTTRAYTRSR